MLNGFPRPIYVATSPVDMRKSFDGLAAVVKNGLQNNGCDFDFTRESQNRQVAQNGKNRHKRLLRNGIMLSSPITFVEHKFANQDQGDKTRKHNCNDNACFFTRFFMQILR